MRLIALSLLGSRFFITYWCSTSCSAGTVRRWCTVAPEVVLPWSVILLAGLPFLRRSDRDGFIARGPRRHRPDAVGDGAGRNSIAKHKVRDQPKDGGGLRAEPKHGRAKNAARTRFAGRSPIPGPECGTSRWMRRRDAGGAGLRPRRRRLRACVNPVTWNTSPMMPRLRGGDDILARDEHADGPRAIPGVSGRRCDDREPRGAPASAAGSGRGHDGACRRAQVLWILAGCHFTEKSSNRALAPREAGSRRLTNGCSSSAPAIPVGRAGAGGACGRGSTVTIRRGTSTHLPGKRPSRWRARVCGRVADDDTRTAAARRARGAGQGRESKLSVDGAGGRGARRLRRPPNGSRQTRGRAPGSGQDGSGASVSI